MASVSYPDGAQSYEGGPREGPFPFPFAGDKLG